jgi:outer membrane protein assembly factor BamE (lipoprotein component of BamABCDE complex)
MTLANVIVLLLVSLALAGCASSGNQSIADATGETVSSQLVKGRTHQTEVRRVFGDPIKTSFASNGNESWEYEFSRMQSKVTNFIPYVNLVHSGAEGTRSRSSYFLTGRRSSRITR